MAVTPLQAATDVLDRADAILALDKKGTPLPTRQDVRRLALAMGMAAIDTQLHWLVRRADLDSVLPKKLASVEVPFIHLVEMGKSSVENRKLGKLDRPQTRARNVLNEALLRMTFQSARQVEGALAMIDVSKPWSALSAKLGEPPKDIQGHLNRLAHRRNLIVHEGDLVRLRRPRWIKHETVDAKWLKGELSWIRKFVAAVDAIT